MRSRLIWLLVSMVVLPITLLMTLGVRGVRDEKLSRQRQVDDVLRARLNDIDARIQHVLGVAGRTLLEMTDSAESLSSDQVRELVRQTPVVDNLFIQAVDGRMVHPPLGAPMSAGERDFLRRTREIFEDKLLLTQARAGEVDDQTSSKLARSGFREAYSWYPWYWDRGLHLIFWRQLPNGSVIGAELNRMRLLADILDELSEVTSDIDADSGVIVLTDSRGRILQRWGDEIAEPSTEVLVNLSAPLSSWTLSCSYGGQVTTPASVTLTRILGLLLAVAGLSGLAIGLYRGSTRELRDAAQRVNFVNQVSHELRTPLTNIRLYAELLQDRFVDEDEKTQAHLSVIVAESHRLSRLIGNVLTFGRGQRGQLKLRMRRGSIGEVVRAAVERFRPALLAKGITVELDIGQGPEFNFDPDGVEQMIGNLLNNVEKYGAAGAWVGVSSHSSGNEVIIVVEDRGPGIPKDRMEDVFKPFVRLKNELTEGVAGTGIGLSLSRDLARLHGGDLRLVASEDGARFELTLPLQGVSI